MLQRYNLTCLNCGVEGNIWLSASDPSFIICRDCDWEPEDLKEVQTTINEWQRFLNDLKNLEPEGKTDDGVQK